LISWRPASQTRKLYGVRYRNHGMLSRRSNNTTSPRRKKCCSHEEAHRKATLSTRIVSNKFSASRLASSTPLKLSPVIRRCKGCWSSANQPHNLRSWDNAQCQHQGAQQINSKIDALLLDERGEMMFKTQ
jgi:hypothetical protein